MVVLSDERTHAGVAVGRRPHLGEGAEEPQRKDAQLQSEARRSKCLGPAADLRGGSGVSLRPTAQSRAATARLPCGAWSRCERLPEQPEQLALRLANILHGFQSHTVVRFMFGMGRSTAEAYSVFLAYKPAQSDGKRYICPLMSACWLDHSLRGREPAGKGLNQQRGTPVRLGCSPC